MNPSSDIRISSDGISAADNPDSNAAADKIMSKVIPLGQRFFPSDGAFPTRKYKHPLAIQLLIVAQVTLHRCSSVSSLRTKASCPTAGHRGYSYNVECHTMKYGTSSMRCMNLRYVKKVIFIVRLLLTSSQRLRRSTSRRMSSYCRPTLLYLLRIGLKMLVDLSRLCLEMTSQLICLIVR